MRNPYYIYTPAWTHISSGVRTLHLLCDALNKHGEKAFLFVWEGDALNPNLDTSVLLPEYDNYYRREGIEPIVVYPDIVKGNPLRAKKSVRYLLASSDYKEEGDMVWGYTSDLVDDKVLTVPTVDRFIFRLPEQENRSGSCFYSYKYDKIFGHKLLDCTAQSKRLDGTLRDVAAILQQSTVCYVYEMSEIILCAQLCGCPVQYIDTPYFSGPPLDWDFPQVRFEGGWQGKFQDEYTAIEKKFTSQLEKFIEETQKWVQK